MKNIANKMLISFRRPYIIDEMEQWAYKILHTNMELCWWFIIPVVLFEWNGLYSQGHRVWKITIFSASYEHKTFGRLNKGCSRLSTFSCVWCKFIHRMRLFLLVKVSFERYEWGKLENSRFILVGQSEKRIKIISLPDLTEVMETSKVIKLHELIQTKNIERPKIWKWWLPQN